MQAHHSLRPQVTTAEASIASQLEAELESFFGQLESQQRQTVAAKFRHGLESGSPQSQAWPMSPEQMSAAECRRLAILAYKTRPELFQTVLTQPELIPLLSHAILTAIVGVMAKRWLQPRGNETSSDRL